MRFALAFLFALPLLSVFGCAKDSPAGIRDASGAGGAIADGKTSVDGVPVADGATAADGGARGYPDGSCMDGSCRDLEPSGDARVLDAAEPVQVDARAQDVDADVDEYVDAGATDARIPVPPLNSLVLVGIWAEVAKISCVPTVEIEPVYPIGELRFDADGFFGVTWIPFETYIDYWGEYRFDPWTGSLDLIVDDTTFNHLPNDIVPSGRIGFEGDELLLIGIWLGSPAGQEQVPGCGHRFQRFR